MARFLGIRHRVKRTSQGEARPTVVAIINDGKMILRELSDDQAELDFVYGKLPVAFRPVEDDEDLSAVPAHQIKWRKLKKGEKIKTFNRQHVSKVDGETCVVDKVPSDYDGLKEGDMAGLVLGGSGDRLAAALSRRGEDIGATVWRIPSFRMKSLRGDSQKEDDAGLLATLVRDQRHHFYQVEVRDRNLILVDEALRARQEALASRIACEQRLRSNFVGGIFLSKDGLYPEGQIEDEFNCRAASDVILQNLVKEEGKRDSDLKKAVEATALWDRIFAPIQGVGPRLAASFIAAIGDIRRFETDAKLKAFCGVHVLDDGRFPRKRGGEVANWNPSLRQALYLLGDQFNRRPESIWGLKQREYKVKLRIAHPHPVVVMKNNGELEQCFELVPGTFEHDKKTGIYTFLESGLKVKGTQRYGDGHIQKMATWRTLTKFVEWLHREWWNMEREYQSQREAA